MRKEKSVSALACYMFTGIAVLGVLGVSGVLGG